MPDDQEDTPVSQYSTVIGGFVLNIFIGIGLDWVIGGLQIVGIGLVLDVPGGHLDVRELGPGWRKIWLIIIGKKSLKKTFINAEQIVQFFLILFCIA